MPRNVTYSLGGNTFNTKEGSIHDNATNTTSTTSKVSCATNIHHTFNHNHDKTILTASDIIPQSKAFDSDNDNSSTQHHCPCCDYCLPVQLCTGKYMPTTISCTPTCSQLLGSELVHVNAAPPHSNNNKFDMHKLTMPCSS